MGEQKDGEKKSKGEGERKENGGGPTTVVLKLDMHCEGCAKKVKRSVKHFDGVESVKADCGSNKLTVIGKVDPAKIKERVEVKTKKKVEIISPQPNKPSKQGGGSGGDGGGEKKSDDKKPDEKKSEEKNSEEKGKSDEKKPEDKKEKPKEPQVSTVVLKTRVHCEGCAQRIRKIIGKCQGVQEVNVDLAKDTITMKGTMNMKELLPYLNVKLKRNVEIAPVKKDGGGGDKKAKEGGGASEKPKEANPEKPKGEGGDKKEDGGGEKKKDQKKDGEKSAEGSSSQENATRIEVNKMEYGGYNPYAYGFGYNYTYDPRQQENVYGHQVVEYWHGPEYSHPPQMFSDENPNACSVM